MRTPDGIDYFITAGSASTYEPRLARGGTVVNGVAVFMPEGAVSALSGSSSALVCVGSSGGLAPGGSHPLGFWPGNSLPWVEVSGPERVLRRSIAGALR